MAELCIVKETRSLLVFFIQGKEGIFLYIAIYGHGLWLGF